MARSSKMLIVDDEACLLESLTRLLKTQDYNVYTASCGKDALDLLKKTAFDLLIIDIYLPDMQGTEVMCSLKSFRPETMVIFITGESDIDTAIETLKHGAYNYLRKPFEFEELLHSVENALNQKALEDEKKQLCRKLYQSEKKYRYLIQNSPDIIFSLDADGYFTFVNEAVEHLLGVSVNVLTGQHYNAIFYEADQEKARQFFNLCRSRNQVLTDTGLRLKVAGKARCANDQPAYLPVELKCIETRETSKENGECHHIVTHGVIRDISERLRLQDQLQHAERVESLGTLAGGIAHNFNNLLMGIQGRTSLIAMDLKPSHPHLEHLNSIDGYIRSGAELTKQLLGLAHGGKYEAKSLNINALIQSTAKLFGRTRKEIIIKTRFHASNILVEADRNQIEQVMLNLYVNAWHAMPEGGTLRLETLPIDLDETTCKTFGLAAGRYAQVKVTDNGIGMAPKTLQRIFDPFFTTKEKGCGTGLGLASAYGIIKNHGGAINAQSELGAGTTFNIYLPVTAKPAVLECVPVKDIARGSETVLLVDDEETVMETSKELLMRLGYKVIAVNSGEAAVATVKQKGADINLVILDIIMPGMDGGWTFDQIRKIDRTMPVVLSSGYAMDDRVKNIMNRGCNGFIQKPFTLSEMSQKIRSVIGA